MALPTLIDQLSATMAVVAVPWELDGTAPSLSVVAFVVGAPAAVATRRLTRLGAGPIPPFWRLGHDHVQSPDRLIQVASILGV